MLSLPRRVRGRAWSVRRWLSLLLCLALLGVAVPASAARPPSWPYASRPCAHKAATAEPRAFPEPVILGGDGHTDVTAVALGTLGERPVAVSAGEEGTLRVWGLPGLEPIGEPVPVGRDVDTIISQELFGRRLTVPAAGPADSATARWNGRAVKATADDELHVTDAASGRQIGPRIDLGEDNGVYGLELITLNGRLTAVTADDGGDENVPGPIPLRFWDVASGTRLDGIEGDFGAVRQTRMNGRTVLVTVNRGVFSTGTARREAGTLSVWDPVSRREIAFLPGHPPPPEPKGVSRGAVQRISLAVGEFRGRPVALTGGGDNTVRLWDLAAAGQLAATVPPGHTDEIASIAMTEAAGRPAAVTKGRDGQTIVWDLVTGRRTALPAPGPYAAARDIPAARLDAGSVIMREDAGSPRFWDLDVSEPPGGWKIGDVQVARLGDRPVLLGRSGAHVWLKDAASMSPIGRPVRLGKRVPMSLAALADLDGRPVLLVNLDGRTRILDFTTGRRLGSVRGVASSEAVIGVTRLRCTTAVLTPRRNTLHLWDLRTGRHLTRPLPGHGARVGNILFGRLGDIPIAVTSSADGDIRVWNLLEGRLIGEPLKAGNRYPVLALGDVNGHEVLLAGGKSERIRMWRLS
ncbi:WD40 repeat domain-containing protein [Thermopolyspora sp. NPDC052614]|uniref:WD40 repeat domain-containing protein n=1 Tax=Thermopolyspora sp. NPDC052614 TaxID=3155682 RepID=UPI0034354868